MKNSLLPCWIIMVLLACVASAQVKTKNLVFVTIDGLRWQEAFRGADDAMANEKFGGLSGKPLLSMQTRFSRDTIHERRAALMPFLWGVIAEKGQIFGNRDR